MSKPQYAWMTLKSWQPEGKPEVILGKEGVSQFCRDFNVAASALDPDFGIIRISHPTDAPIHTMMLEPSEAKRLSNEYPLLFDGPWDNPEIRLVPDNKPKPKPF